MKKFVAILLVLMMALAMVPAMAAGGVAKIGSTIYETVQEAVNAANNGDTIVLTANSEIGNNAAGCIKIPAGLNVTLDLNGKTISQKIVDSGLSVAAVAIRDGAELTIKDSVGGGKIRATKTVIQLSGILNLEGGELACDVTPTAADVAESFAYNVWFYAPGSEAPEFNMTGGTLSLGSAQESFDYPYAVTIDDTFGTMFNAGNISVNITDGNVEGVLDLGNEATVVVTGGTFGQEVPVNYIGDNLYSVSLGNGKFTVGPLSVPETGDEATIILWSAMILLAGAALIMMKKKSYNY